MTDVRTIGGIRIEGTPVTSGRDHYPQRPTEELIPYLTRIVRQPELEALVWTQYTPYFNDGEACEFSTGDFGVIQRGKDYAESLGKYYDVETREDLYRVYPDELDTPGYGLEVGTELYDAVRDLGQNAKYFQNAFMELFGDHARVIATREKFIIDEYEHD